jgi:hypothetical protein
MQAQASAISAPQFVVEVEHPYNADDSQDVRFECATVEDLAGRIEDLTGWSEDEAGDAAFEITDGKTFEHVDEETGRTVTAYLAGGRSQWRR